jgi:limonene-1,2-epoxide hydrolase
MCYGFSDNLPDLVWCRSVSSFVTQCTPYVVVRISSVETSDSTIGLMAPRSIDCIDRNIRMMLILNFVRVFTLVNLAIYFIRD